MTSEQPIIRERSVVDSLRFLHRELIDLADGDARLVGVALSLSMVAKRAEAELAEAWEEVRIREAQTARLDTENKRLCQENDDLTVGCGIPDTSDDDYLDDLLRTANDRVVRQLNDVIDVDAGLSEILTRHEGEL